MVDNGKEFRRQGVVQWSNSFFSKKIFLRRRTLYIHRSSPLPDIRMKVTLCKLEIWKETMERRDDKTYRQIFKQYQLFMRINIELRITSHWNKQSDTYCVSVGLYFTSNSSNVFIMITHWTFLQTFIPLSECFHAFNIPCNNNFGV